MKKLFLLILYGSTIFNSKGQTSSFQTTKDALKMRIERTMEDTTRVNLLIDLSERYPWSYPDTALQYAHLALSLAVKIDYKKGIYGAQNVIIYALTTMGNFPLALEYVLKNKELSKTFIVPKSNAQFEQGLKLTRSSKNFLSKNQADSALYYAKRSFQLINNWPTQPINIGHAYLLKNIFDSAVYWFKIGLTLATVNETEQDFVDVDNLMAILYKKKNNIDSSIWYSKKALCEKISMNYPLGTLKASDLLVSIYESQNKQDSAFKYLKMSISLKDSIFSREKAIAEQNLLVNERERELSLEAQQLKSKNQIRLNSLLGGFATLLIISFLLFRNNQHKQKSFNLLQGQKQKIDIQKTDLEYAYSNLKSTQAQLIQSEKMASLGELTAGIAHEIQNPLNFVNNFASINTELIDEMKLELSIGNMQSANEIADTIKENEEKINHHGKRAESIVRGMLQHSRKSTATKEPTDINALADEYMRLSYHGLRAKDKSFNADFKMDLDPTLPLVKVIPQDIGRVLLNLFNNAFWVTNEKQHNFNKWNTVDITQGDDNQAVGSPKSVSDLGGRGKTESLENDISVQPPAPKRESISAYQPTVTLSTKSLADHIEIRIYDNGSGIPPLIIDKIFQPFFTTKPTGQGTGLGLSLAYDIIKAHGGTIEVKSSSAGNENTWTEFIIQLPI